MALQQRTQTPPAKVSKYKVAFMGKADNELQSKMFDVLPDAIAYAKLVDGLIFEANTTSDPKTGAYSWTVLPESPMYRSYKVGIFIYTHRKIIAVVVGILILVLLYFRYKDKIGVMFANGGAVETPMQPASAQAPPIEVPAPTPSPQIQQ
jgi:hypothetical protein